MQKVPLLKHVRDILLLPFTVTVIIPYLLEANGQIRLADNPVILSAGATLMAFGCLLAAYTIRLFHVHGKGTLAPWSEKQKLVINGPYRYCRNPMITGVLCILAGEALLLQSVDILTWLIAFFIINTTYFIVFEEPQLEKKFGAEYLHYKKHVPRWIPNVRGYRV